MPINIMPGNRKEFSLNGRHHLGDGDRKQMRTRTAPAVEVAHPTAEAAFETAVLFSHTAST